MKATIRRSNNCYKLPTYQKAIEHLAKIESNTAQERLVCRIFTVPCGRDPLTDGSGFVRIESQVVKDIAKMREYTSGLGSQPRLRRCQIPSYQAAVSYIDVNNPDEVYLIADLYGEHGLKVLRDAKRAQEVPDDLPALPLAPPTIAPKLKAIPTAAAPSHGNTDDMVKPWLCGFCQVTLSVGEVYSHFQVCRESNTGD